MEHHVYLYIYIHDIYKQSMFQLKLIIFNSKKIEKELYRETRKSNGSGN